jgi:hypothetical protein
MSNIILVIAFLTTSHQQKLPPMLLSSLCYVESRHHADTIHHDDGGTDSLGTCQVKLATAQWLGFKGTEKQLMEPRTNIHYAGLYLRYQLTRYHGDVTKAVITYNRGNAKGLTSTAYSDKVLKQWREHK